MTPEGVMPNDSKIRAVKEFPRPTTLKKVKSFLGLVNYYRNYSTFIDLHLLGKGWSKWTGQVNAKRLFKRRREFCVLLQC